MVPHHDIDIWLQVQIFYDHVNQTTRHAIDHSAGGKLRDKSAKESWELIKNLALYDHKRKEDGPKETKILESSAVDNDDHNFVVEDKGMVEKAQIRRIFLDGYNVLDVRIAIFKISSFKLQNAVILSDDDFRRGYESPLDLENEFYKDIDKLGPSYNWKTKRLDLKGLLEA
uniref:Zinc finger, CCHC-type n=1 Tax=Tanacetum cinerariifolium TaxID=118510 RepID=A0A6L2M6Z0_TANCI|nr:zinc finger, CCHC-type [Tanacetum cinerariifolium]